MAHSFKAKIDYTKYTLDFKFDAGTSRGVLKSKDTYIVRASSDDFKDCYGLGEAGPLPKLSVDDLDDFEEKLGKICVKVSGISIPDEEEEVLELLKEIIPEGLPSIRFALEVALLDLIHGGKRKIFPNTFYDDQTEMNINGLIWMGDREFMLEQIGQKLKQGYTCIKMKIGSIDFDQECALLAFIRDRFSKNEITLRVDANGAFSQEDVLPKLQRLSAFELHSIEQPIKQGQWQAMKNLCQTSPVPIALDEELIGIYSVEEKINLLEVIRPPYIILKPTLTGGIFSTREWISLAEQRNIGWWMTSALESNIGLNAIAQLAAVYQPPLPQGLGTGQLYHNNIDSPLTVHNGKIFYDKKKSWGDLETLFGKRNLEQNNYNGLF